MKKYIALTTTLITFVFTNVFSAVLVDFNAAGDYSATDWQTPGGSFDAGAFTINPTGDGVGAATGRLDAVSAGAANGGRTVNINGVAETNLGFYSASVFFLTGTVNTGEISSVGIGLTRSTGSAPGNLDDTAGSLTMPFFSGDGLFAGFRSDGDFAATGTKFGIFGTGGSTIATDDITLSDNTWYEMSLDITMTSATAGSYTTVIGNRGADGVTVGSDIVSLSGAYALTNNGYNGTELFGVLGGGNNSGDNVVAFDDFAVIPEPGTLALVGIAIGTLAIFRRRK